MANEHEDDIDATEEKAKAIGKEIGVEGDDVPEYDIREEDDDVDERVGKERDTETKEARKEREKLSNRDKRQLRKKKINEKFNEKDAIIRSQQEQLDHLNRRMAEVDGRLTGINRAEVDKAFNDTAAAYKQAEIDHMTAFNEGDGAKATAAMRNMYQAEKRLEQLGGLKKQLENAPQQTHQPTHQGPDRVVVSKAKEWAERNSWYNAGAGDTDSEVAKAISGALVKEGFDPKSDDFWDELDDRLSSYIPDKVSSDLDEEEDDEPVKITQRKRSAPPISGGGSRSDVKGKKTITLPTSYVNTLKANGLWDDPVKRNKIIAERERILRESRA